MILLHLKGLLTMTEPENGGMLQNFATLQNDVMPWGYPSHHRPLEQFLYAKSKEKCKALYYWPFVSGGLQRLNKKRNCGWFETSWRSSDTIVMIYQYCLSTFAWHSCAVRQTDAQTLIARFMDQRGAHLGSTGPRWAPCWPHELCYLSS